MATGILAAALGLLIAAACISIPQLVRRRHTQPDNDDTQAYLKQTGQSARDIAERNAALRAQQQAAIRPDQKTHADGGGEGAGPGQAEGEVPPQSGTAERPGDGELGEAEGREPFQGAAQ